MKRTFAIAVVMSLALATSAFAHTAINIGVQLGNAPPPPMVVYREEPRWVAVPHQRVYVVDDDDIDYDYFRYGGSYYIFNSGCWYRGRSYRGPFMSIETRYVPRTIYGMGDRDYHWRHHPQGMPPGLAKKMDRDGDGPPGWRHGKGKWKDHGDHDHH